MPTLLRFLSVDYFPKVTTLKFEASVYKFDSPLNFLMLRTDFKEFLEAFYQAESLLKYALQLQIANLFTVEVRETAKAKRQDSIQLMLDDFFKQMYRCIEILKEYDHLIQHDTKLECSQSMTFGCFFRKYGATMSILAVFTSGAVMYFKRKIEEVE